MLKQQLKKRGCAGSQCVSGRTWAACGGSRGHLFSPRISLGRPWLGSWLGTQLCTECWGPGGKQALTGFGLDYPVSGSKSKRAAPGLLLLPEAVLRRAALQTLLYSEGKRRQLQLNADKTLSREAAFRSSRDCGFRRDGPWRKLVSEQPSQGPPAGPF